MKKIISLSAAILLCTSFAVGCGKDKSSSSEAEKVKNKYEGKWQSSEFIIEGKSFDTFYGTDPRIIYQIELFEGNKGTFYSFLLFDKDIDKTIEWKEIEDNKIEVKGEALGEPLILEYQDDRFILNFNDEDKEQDIENLAYLDKVDEFRAVTEDDSFSLDLSGEASAEFEVSE